MIATDLPEVATIEKVSNRFPWTEQILLDCLTAGYNCWVMQRDHEYIGYMIAMIALRECHLLNICIRPNYQRLGYGRKLMGFLLDFVKAKNVNVVFLEVRQSNQAALALYNEYGFNEISVRKNYYPSEQGQEDAIVLALTL